jgi:hypothetical protein
MISLIGIVSSLVDMFSTVEALRVFGRCSRVANRGCYLSEPVNVRLREC